MCGQGHTSFARTNASLACWKLDGAFADSICVPEKCCFTLKDDVSFDVASLVEPFAVALHGVRHAGDIAGKTVLVVGAGTIGLLALSCLKLLGAGKVIVSDINETRLKVATAMGADETVNPAGGDFEGNISKLTGGNGVDIAIEAVGSSVTVQQASKALRFGGTVVWLGNNKPMIEMNMQEVVTREQRLFGSFLYTLDDFRQVIDWINSGKANVDALISKTAPMSEGVFYFEKLAHDPGDLIKVVLNNE
jgi:L-iditol 2-dehydrogenase